MGHLKEIWANLDEMHDHWSKYHQHSETFAVHLPFWPVKPASTFIMTADPKNVEHILKTRFDNYIKAPCMTHPH